jgi:hypothetical protein
MQLYRCSVIWSSSRYARVVVAIPLFLILMTAGIYLPTAGVFLFDCFCSQFIESCIAIGYATIYLVLDIRFPFVFALLTNLVLLGLTGMPVFAHPDLGALREIVAGRIWNKGRAAAVLLGITVHRRYTATLEVM